VGEALYLRKPLLVIPECCVEQRMNALAVQRLGIGRKIDLRELTLPTLRDFIEHVDFYRERMAAQFHDGLPAALEVLDQFLADLVPAAVRTESPSVEHVVS
jgi:UDP:flavonoid glycosyltransferase YjiC (YdhE family)